MSGHNKWSTIKHKKGAADAKRGAIFTKLIKEVTVAARMGGGDPGANPRLRSAILACRAANMPKDNIERGIKKGTGELEGVDYIETSYEGYGPAGVAIFIEVLTDNKNRTVGDIRHAFTKNNGNMGTDGSVAWMFERKGQIVVGGEDTNVDEDKLLEAALESGAEDMQREGDMFFVTTSIADLYTVRDGIEKGGFPIQEAKLVRNPTTTVPINEAQAAQVLRLVDWLEENDDVQNVYHNADIDDAIMEKLS